MSHNTSSRERRRSGAARPLAQKAEDNPPQREKTPPPINGENGPALGEAPEILAPAGDMQAALAGLAAGADALYLGLKHFSARMQAENFSTRDLASLVDLAHEEGRRIYVAMNTLVKPSEPPQAFRLIRRLALDARPDALIVQDPAMLDLARQAGFAGELHLSTLANVTHPKALLAARSLGADRVIVPRELSLEEARLMDASCPEGLALEIFVHGALCYCVSGRCWWSSYMGGKSGLRGRCVQPCRRVYKQKGQEGRFFSCQDLSLDVLTRSLLALPRIRSWKIEGRKKGPHYVYYATTAYRLLRDEPDNPDVRKEAEALLGMALGRPGTRSLFGKGEAVTSPDVHMGSGLLCGRVSGTEGFAAAGGRGRKAQGAVKTSAGERSDKGRATAKDAPGGYVLRPRIDLLPGDFLRLGSEDEPWHCTFSVPAPVTAGASFTLRLPRGKHPKSGTPVFLIDRREPELKSLLREWERDLQALRDRAGKEKDAEGNPDALENVGGLFPAMPEPRAREGGSRKSVEVFLFSSLPHGKEAKTSIKPGVVQGLWLSPKSLREVSKTLYSRILWWLPPVIWPDEEESWQKLVVAALRGNARRFVCNAPWQTALFPREEEILLTAGPFCNTTNAVGLDVLRGMGFSAAVVSPELGEEHFLTLPGQSPLPLGIVLSGFWPVGIARHRLLGLSPQEGFQSPKGEEFWARRYGQNTWLYPAWPLDISKHRPALERAGYSLFIHMDEHPPKALPQASRSSEFNWSLDVL